MASRWVVFDPATALELRSSMPGAAVFEAPGRTAVDYALSASRSVVVVHPADSGNGAWIAIFRPERMQASPPQTAARTRPGGILGLSEEFELEEEGPPAKTNWWRRFWPG